MVIESQQEAALHGDDVNFFHRLGRGQETAVACLQIIDISERTQFHLMVRSCDDFDQEFKREQQALSVKLQDIDVGFANDDIEVQTAIVNSVYEWSFRLKDKPKS